MVDFSGKVHCGIGLLIGLATGLSSPITGIGIAIGSILPDCDIKGSPASIIPLWLFVKHRTYTHSLFACLTVSLLASVFSLKLAEGMFIGYFLHLIADSTTPMKTKYILWPYKKV